MRIPTKQTFGMIALAGLLIGACLVLVLGARTFVSWNVHGDALSAVTAFTSRIRQTAEVAARAFSGRDETTELKHENAMLLAELAELEDVREENAFLRRIADLPARQGHRALTGNMFNYGVLGTEMRILLNIGERDGVVPGSAVVTETGALLGLVSEVRERSSAVVVLGDPSVQVTGKIEGTDVAGLVRTDQAGRLTLDLIGRDEAVTEGQVVVSSGLDNMPAGLRIGTIRTVDAERTTLFQVITIDPAFRDGAMVRVLVLI